MSRLFPASVASLSACVIICSAGATSIVAANPASVVPSKTTTISGSGFGAAHLGWNPHENTLNTSNLGSLGLLWQISANGLGGAPIVSGGGVFLGTGSGLEAVSTASRTLAWKALPASTFYASPALSGSTIYIGDTGSTRMYALNATTGATVWSQTTGGAFESSAVVVGGSFMPAV